MRENVTVADPEANGSTNSSSVAVAILVPFFALIFAGLGFYLYKQRYVARQKKKKKQKANSGFFACRLLKLATLVLMLCKHPSLFFFLFLSPILCGAPRRRSQRNRENACEYTVSHFQRLTSRRGSSLDSLALLVGSSNE